MDSKEIKEPRRAWRYKYGEKARIFVGDDILKAELDGWVDSPDLCKAPEKAAEKVPAPVKNKPGPKPKVKPGDAGSATVATEVTK